MTSALPDLHIVAGRFVSISSSASPRSSRSAASRQRE
jgi:hypothetical protein